MTDLVIARTSGWPDGIAALLVEAAADPDGAFMDGLAADWQAFSGYGGQGEGLFAARQDGRLAGVAVISRDPFIDAPAGRLRFIYVAQAARGQGVLQRFVDICLAHGSRWPRIRLSTENPRAARVYMRMGFVATPDAVRATHELCRPGIVTPSA